MITLINIIIISLIIGLLIYIYFVLIRKLSNNYKVLLLPFITLLNSVSFGYKAFKNSDDIVLIIWIIIFFTSILLIGIIFRKIYLSKQKEVVSNKTIINNYLEQNNNVTNIQGKQHNNYEKEKKKNDDSTTNEKSLINLTDEQLKKIYNFFVDNDLLAEVNMEFNVFEESFLNKPLRVNMEGTVLREFYDKLVIQKNIYFKDNDTYLSYFINSKDNSYYKKSTFNKQKNYKSKLTDKINELFSDFK